MIDAFITAINTQYATVNWMDVIADNMTNVYTPGFKEKQVNFKTFLGGAINDDYDKKMSQGKSTPGTSNDNVFLEGKGFFLTKTPEGKSAYTDKVNLLLMVRVFIAPRMVTLFKVIS